MPDFFSVAICDFNERFHIIIEDDGRVAYAYLIENENNIVGDVWLYNQAKTPEKTEWIESEMPFLNPLEYTDAVHVIAPLQDASDVKIDWVQCEGVPIEAKVFIRNVLVAILKPQALPGWSFFVKKDGPLAKKAINPT